MSLSPGRNLRIVLEHPDFAKKDFYGVVVFLEMMFDVNDFTDNPKVALFLRYVFFSASGAFVRSLRPAIVAPGC